MKSTLSADTLLELLSERPEAEIKKALIGLMIKGKINFADVVTSYVYTLQSMVQINKDKLAEASACILGQFLNNDEKGEDEFKQRSLYYLNEIDRSFNMKETNKKFNYNKSLGKKACYFAKFYSK